MEPEPKPASWKSRDSGERETGSTDETVPVNHLAQKFDSAVRDKVYLYDPMVKRRAGVATTLSESPLSGYRLGEAIVLDGCSAVYEEAPRRCTSAEEDQDQAFNLVCCQSMFEYPMDHDSSRCTTCILSNFFGPIN